MAGKEDQVKGVTTDARWQGMKRDMYAVLMDKTDGDALLLVRNRSRDGLMGYMRVNKWFTEMSGRGLAERKRAVMRTTEVKHEEDIFQAIEQWEEELRDLRRITGEEVMSEMLMKTALKEICCGKIKEWVDMKEETLDYSEVREEVMKFAMKKRVERNRPKHPQEWMWMHSSEG